MTDGTARRLVAGLVAVGLVVGLPVAAGQYHQFRRHQGCTVELEDAVEARKPLAQFLEDPRPDGLAARFSSDQVAELSELAAVWNQELTQINAKARRSAYSAVFKFGDMVYFVFFDATGRLREFVCVAN